MSSIDTAVVLAAGEGSRLRAVAPFKPLCPVAGTPLIAHAIDRLAAIGIGRVVVVTGYGSDAVEAYLDARTFAPVVSCVRTQDHHAPNGVSLLAAQDDIGSRDVLLTMCDHLVDPALYARVCAAGAGPGLTLGVDRRLANPSVDPDDVTRVATRGDAIVAIGKGLADYDAFDTGVFAIGPRFLSALAGLADPSITEGVRVLAAADEARVCDTGDLGWIDVDDPVALTAAERWLASTD